MDIGKATGYLTRKAALYGNPMARLAKTAAKRLARGDLKAKLCEISWMARKRFWFAVAPIMYDANKNGHEMIGVSRTTIAVIS